jgi:ankyrin repeat protein
MLAKISTKRMNMVSNAKDKEGKSVLMRAKQKGNKQIIQMLKDAGAKG